MFTEKIRSIKVPKPIEIGLKAREMNRAGIDVIDLSMGQPDFLPNIDAEETGELINTLSAHAYSDNFGLHSLRESLAGYLGEKHSVRVEIEEVMVTPGAKLGFYYILSALLERGDSIVVPQPSWVSYVELANWNENKAITIGSDPADGFITDPGIILRAIGSNTRAVVINSPVNPTGVIWPADSIIQLYLELEKRNIFLILDAIYDDFDFFGKSLRLVQFGQNRIPGKLIYLHGFSKMFSMAGHRLGYVLADSLVISEMAKAQAQLMTCPSTFSQNLALGLLKSFDQNNAAKQCAVYERRVSAAMKVLEYRGVGYVRPDGAFYILVDTRFIDGDSVKAAKTILEQCRVAVVPGIAFGAAAEGYVRLTMIQPDERIQEAVERICRLSRSPE